MFMKKADRCDFTKSACMLIILMALLAVTLLCFSNGISGNDFWWHVKVGEWITEHKKVPTTDIFSWCGMEKGISWTAHEWLADVIFYGIYSAVGMLGIFLFSIVAAISMLFLMFNQARKHIERNFLVSGLFLVLFAVVASLFFYGRPHVFSYFLLFVELKILYVFFEDHDSKSIYYIPLIAALWSNLHGGSASLAYILCAVFLLAGMFNIGFGRIESTRFDRKAAFKLMTVAIGSVIGVLINPIGFKVLAYPYVNLSDDISMSVISEWQAPDAKVIGNLVLYFLPMLMMLFGVICGKMKIRMIDLLIMFAFMFLFFRSARFIVLWYIAAIFCAFRYMPEIRVKSVTRKSEKIAVLALVALLIVPCVLGITDTIETYKNGNLVSVAMSKDAVQAVKDDAPQRIYNDYNLGEALIYNEIPVFFDARADLYAQENIMADGISLMYLEPVRTMNQNAYVDVDDMIEKYDFDAILILKGRSLYSYLMNHPERFKLIYEDESLGYFRIYGG